MFGFTYYTPTKVIFGREAELQTAEQIKQALQEIVDGENKKKPLSDGAISEALAARGMAISRRTVNKYRTELGIPDKTGRRSWDV